MFNVTGDHNVFGLQSSCYLFFFCFCFGNIDAKLASDIRVCE